MFIDVVDVVIFKATVYWRKFLPQWLDDRHSSVANILRFP